MLRSQVIASIRRRMIEQGFHEFQTPILTASSPEGARDYLVPSRLHPGKFYALPQAPQQFKQLLMVAGFDRYFQIAPCFRDEASRADRSPGEFYQLDFEMSFVTQEDVFAAIEPVLHGVFEEFGRDRKVTPPPFPRITYRRCGAQIRHRQARSAQSADHADVTGVFRGSEFKLLRGDDRERAAVMVRAIPAPGGGSRAFLRPDERLGAGRGRSRGSAISSSADGEGAGPVARGLGRGTRPGASRDELGLKDGDAVFFVGRDAAGNAGNVRRPGAHPRSGRELGLVEQGAFRFCWIVDFPMYERNEETGQIEFSHNPFSMPQGGLEALETQDPLTIHAFQYDIVCNGVELSSGAIRNHRPDIMYKAFAIAGYTPGRGRGTVRRHAQCVPLRRAAAWRLGAGHRPHRDAARRHAEHPRGRRLPDEPAGGRPADAGAGRGAARAAEGAAHPPRPAAAPPGSRRQRWLKAAATGPIYGGPFKGGPIKVERKLRLKLRSPTVGAGDL